MNIPATDRPMSFVEKDRIVDQQIQSMDWSVTPVGDRGSWPNRLVSAIDTLMVADYPMFLFWGSDHTFFYNDAAALLFTSVQQHAGLFTQAIDAWPAMWYRLQPVIDGILKGSSAPFLEDVPISIHRQNVLVEAYWNLIFSRIKGDSGAISGVMVTCTIEIF